ncbi:uncharacterized protein N0V89_010726 [Didymosphaeria variabile]|uniref:Uncharacterized protein n=1 Tax=Didymosphaeria variabile TaxID=1932322 RepID=A0A9W8XBT8_9PLEO|nr:uncharacterized protein N0V89_010726 [Didymosphaeria variabile]KAJ4346794.1 hypothetical protein N0V89_010726 [Didymosphaeria variabile]
MDDDGEQQRDKTRQDGGTSSNGGGQQVRFGGFGRLYSGLRPAPASGRFSPGWLGLSGARQHPLPAIPSTPRSPHRERGTGLFPMLGSPSRGGHSPAASPAVGKTPASLRRATPHPAGGGVFGHIAAASSKRPRMDMMGEAEFAQLETDLREIRDGKKLRANVPGFKERMQRMLESAVRADDHSREHLATMDKRVEECKERTKRIQSEDVERKQSINALCARVDALVAETTATCAEANAYLQELDGVKPPDLLRQQEPLPRPLGTSAAPISVGASTDDDEVERLR